MSDELRKKNLMSGNVFRKRAPRKLGEAGDEAASEAADAGKTYIVQAGDTLAKIAKAMYGDGSRWREILKANQDTISNPDLIQVGQELRIP